MTAASEVDESDATSPRSWPTLALGAALLAPLLFLAVAAARQTWWPVHDFALIDLRARDVGTSATPLIGPYSRFGWSHPGPLLFFLLAPFSRVASGAPTGLLAGAVVLNGAAVAGALVVARRRGGTVLVAAVAVGLALLLRALGADLLASPWNAWLVVLPTVLLGLLCWSLAAGDAPSAPFVVLVGSFLVQTHLGVAPVVLAMTGVGAVGFILARRGRALTAGPATPTDRRWLLGTLAVGVVVWLPPLIDQLTGTGNLGLIARFFVGAQPDRPPLRTALGVAGTELGPLGPWLRGTAAEPLVPFEGTLEPGSVAALAVPFVALALAGVVAFRRRDRDGLWLVAVATGAAAATVLALVRMSDAVWDYVVRWSWAVGLLVWLAVGRALVPAVAALFGRRRSAPGDEVGELTGNRADERDVDAADVDARGVGATRAGATPANARRGTGVAVAVAVAAVVVLGLVVSIPGLTGPEVPEAKAGAPVGAVADAVVAGVGHPGGPVVVRPVDAEVRFPLPSSRQPAAGLADVLERAGIPVRVVEEDWTFARGGGGHDLFGPSRVADGTEAGTVLVAAGDSLDTFVPPAGAVEIARAEDAAGVAERRRLERELTDAFNAAGHPDAAARVSDAGVAWVVFDHPDLGRYGEDIERLVALRDERRLAVWWVPAGG